MSLQRWTKQYRVFILLAVGLVVLLIGAVPSSRGRSLEYVHRLTSGSWHPKVEEQFQSEASDATPDATLDGTTPPTSDESATKADTPSEGEEVEEGGTIPEEVWRAQLEHVYHDDLSYRLPKFDVARLKNRRAHNYKGPGHPTFATFYATRDAGDRDPYFISSQQIVYRLLWDPHIRSADYPVTVFVEPFISQEKRDYFTAAGALVRELPIVNFEPLEGALENRYQDVMSKLMLWNQTEFSRIAFLDSDAFPWRNIDFIMDRDRTPVQQCRWDSLSEEQKKVFPSPDSCDYVFAAHTEEWYLHVINAGFMVMKPDPRISDMLVKLSKDQEAYDNSWPEQGPISLLYHPDGPFPSTVLSKAWKAAPDQTRTPDKQCFVMHAKLWAPWFAEQNHVQDDYNATWSAMLDLYESARFTRLRQKDDKGVDVPPSDDELQGSTESVEKSEDASTDDGEKTGS